MSDVVTTEWHSVFSYDNVDYSYFSGNLFPADCPDYMVIGYNGSIYAISNPDIVFAESGFSLSNGGGVALYDTISHSWGVRAAVLPVDLFQNGMIPYSSVEIYAQNISRSTPHFFTTNQFHSGDIYAPTGSVFDGMYTTDTLGGVLGVLPAVLFVLCGFIAIRKGIEFVVSLLRWG